LISSVVAFAEVMTGVVHGHHQEEKVRRFFQAPVTKVLPVDVAVAERAAELRGTRHSLKLPDALILSTADMHDETELVVTGDAAWADVPGLCCRVDTVRA
jgi:PIN domain nuclease of toxin-antitoxin system